MGLVSTNRIWDKKTLGKVPHLRIQTSIILNDDWQRILEYKSFEQKILLHCKFYNRIYGIIRFFFFQRHAVDWIQEEGVVRVLLGKRGTVICTLSVPHTYPQEGSVSLVSVHGGYGDDNTMDVDVSPSQQFGIE